MRKYTEMARSLVKFLYQQTCLRKKEVATANGKEGGKPEKIEE